MRTYLAHPLHLVMSHSADHDYRLGTERKRKTRSNVGFGLVAVYVQSHSTTRPIYLCISCDAKRRLCDYSGRQLWQGNIHILMDRRSACVLQKHGMTTHDTREQARGHHVDKHNSNRHHSYRSISLLSVLDTILSLKSILPPSH